MSGVLLAAIAIPALLFVAWPLLRGRASGIGLLPLPPDPRQQLLEEKELAGRALRELAFEHEAGHLSDDDHAMLRDRYELRAAETLVALESLDISGEKAARPVPTPTAPPRPWTAPGIIAINAAALLVFGVLLGLGVARYSIPSSSGLPAASGSRPLAPSTGDGPAGGASRGAGRPLDRETLGGMLRAARASLVAGRYGDAIAAYQAVLKRDQTNVDALTHLGLLLAIGGHADTALTMFDQALGHDPTYPPALFYRGQVLYEVKKDYPGALKSWDKFLAVVPQGAEHDRVAALARDARTRSRRAGSTP